MASKTTVGYLFGMCHVPLVDNSLYNVNKSIAVFQDRDMANRIHLDALDIRVVLEKVANITQLVERIICTAHNANGSIGAV